MITLTAKITLADGTEIPINKKNALSIDENIIDRGDIILPSWGIISNSGKISFIDYKGDIKYLAQNLKLTSKTKVNIYLNNTFLNQPVSIGEFFATRWNYENNGNEVSVSITDGLQKMQDISITPLSKNAKTGGTISGQDFYVFLHKQTISNGFDMLSFDELDASTRTHLSYYVISMAYMEKKSLWRAWQEFCEALQLHIYKSQNGKIICIYKEGD